MDLPTHGRPIYGYGHLLAYGGRTDVLIAGLDALDLSHIGSVLSHQIDLGSDHPSDDLNSHDGRLGLAEDAVGKSRTAPGRITASSRACSIFIFCSSTHCW